LVTVTLDAAALTPPSNPRRESVKRVFTLIPQTDDFASGNGIGTVGGTAQLSLDPASAYDNNYTVHYVVTVTINGASTYGTATLVVAIETNDGSGWVEKATYSHNCSYLSGPPPYSARTCSSWPHEQKVITVSGLGLNDNIRLKAKSFSTTNGAGGSFAIRGGDAGGSNPETYNGVTYTTLSPAPIVDASPYNYAKQDYSRCAVGCFAAIHRQSTTPYFSLDKPRFVTLAYNSDRVNPRPFVHVNVSPEVGFSETATEYRLQIKVNGVLKTFLNGEQMLRFAYPGQVTARLGGQFDAAGYNTGVYPMNILVSAVYPIAGVQTSDIATKFVVVNDTNSAIAAGWTLAGIQRLYLQSDSSALITEGDGNAVYFARSGGAYLSPDGEFSKLATTSPSGWTRSYPDSTKLVFNNLGRMIQIRDRFSNVDTIKYDGSWRVSQIKDPLNNAITLTYDGNGLTAIQDPGGRLTEVVVDASKRLTMIIDPGFIGTTFGYDASLRLRAITNRAGDTDSLNYLVTNSKETNKLASVKGPAIPVFGGGSSSPVTTFEPWQIKGVPYGTTTGTPFNPPIADTVYARLTEPLGAAYVTRFTVNGWGSPVQLTDAIGQVTTIVYHNTGLPWTVQRPWYGALRDTLLYDGSGLLTYQRPAGDSATTITYGGWAQPTNVATPGRPTVTYTLGSFGLVSSVRWGGTTRASYLYDGYGRVTRVTDGRNTVMHRLGYPTTGLIRNLTRDTMPGNRVTFYTYDTYGRRDSVRVPSSPQQITYYNSLNWVDSIRTLTPSVPRVKFAYDRLGRDTSVTDPQDQTYKYTYNALGWLIRLIDPVGARDTFQYSIGGELRRSTNRLGQNLDYAYDLLHRDTSRTGSVTARWMYTPNSLVVTATQPGIATVTSYLSTRGVPDSVRTVLNGYTYWQRYRYGSTGLDSVYFAGSQDASHLTPRGYGYNANTGALDAIRLGSSNTTLGYDANLSTTMIDFPGSTIDTRTLGSLNGSLTSTPEAANSSLLERWYGFNSRGQIDRYIWSPGTGGRWFEYNSLGQLIASMRKNRSPEGSLPPNCPDYDYGMSGSCTPNVDWVTNDSVGFSYDAVGNRTDQGGSYLTGNRIQAFAGCTYNTDAAGNVVSRKGTTPCVQIDTLLWTPEGWLDSIKVGTTGIRFLYDADGRLTAKRVNGTTVSWFLWDGVNLLAELTDSGDAVATEYSYYGMDAPHAVIKQPAGTRLYARMDALGSVLALTDQSASIRTSYEYDDWGKLTSSSDNEGFGGRDRARWKGALWMGPEIDAYYMRNRWYEPQSGRFLSEDPIGLMGGLNPVAFAGNDPVNRADPSGLIDPVTIWGDPWVWDFAAIFAALQFATYWDYFSRGSDGRPSPGRGTRSPSAAVGRRRRDIGVEAERACANNGIGVVLSVAADATLVIPIIKAYQLAGQATRLDVYAQLRSWDGARRVAWGVGRRSVEIAHEARAAVGGALIREQIGERSVHAAHEVSTGGFNWDVVKDIVPIWGTGRAAGRWSAACFPK
jgi:RHS repeat-associated protein